jgi:acyl-CoA thioesterase
MTVDIPQLKKQANEEPVAEFLGMELERLEPGYSRVVINLRTEHLNFNGLVFGGIIMALADQAFAFAANSIIRPNIASQFNINLLSAPKPQTKLIAEGRVLKQGKRAGVTEITVTDESGHLIAKATGTTVPIQNRPILKK